MPVAYVRTPAGFEVDFYVQDAAPTWPQATLQLITLNPPKGNTLPPEIQLHLAPDWLLKGNTSS